MNSGIDLANIVINLIYYFNSSSKTEKRMEKMIEFVADGLVFDVLHGLLKESNFSEQIQIERFYMQTTLEISEKIRITIVCQKKYVTDLFIKMDALISNNGGIWDTYSIITYDRITSAKK